MTFRTIMNSIGNAFKTGIKNGNIQKGLKIAGASAFGIGMTGAMIHDMKNTNQGSIFGCCGMNPFGMSSMGMSPFGMGGGMFGCFGMNPYGMSMGMSPFGMMNCGSMFDSMGMLNSYNMYGTNPYLTQAGNMAAYQYGQQVSEQIRAQNGFMSYNTELTDEQIDKIAPERSNKKVVANTVDTGIGEKFDEETSAIGNNTSRESVTLSDKAFSNGDKQTYIDNLGKIADSYIAYMGTNGTISEDAFIDKEIEKYQEQNPNYDISLGNNEQLLRNQYKMAFAKMDLNRDGELDRNEMISLLATYDAGGKAFGASTNLGDGKITAAEYKAAQSSIKANNSTFANNNWSNYQRLFGVQKKSE